ncbi:MAG: 5-(carboxyamino)imidazole ribonucleotide mutase [Elusimicrobia bacterium]|nr:5-(carboxyamino)imidazole ribonucleotide mutase [Elusimicrobiota bacterium]
MKQAKVAIFMGSESDLPVMSKAAELLAAYGVEHTVTVASAHRSPEFLHERVAESEKEGVQVFVAGAGGAAHLAGVLASRTVKPVIGVPMGSKLSGFDSLLSTVQMPRGVPVATVAIEGAENAALLAVQILALADPALSKRLMDERKRQASEIAQKGRKK